MQTHSTIADPEMGPVDDIVSRDYPISDPSAGAELAAEVSRQLVVDGAATLPGFLRSDALSAIAHDLEVAAAHVPLREHAASVYHRTDLEVDLAADDPRRVRQTWFAGHVTRDMIPVYTPAHRLYVSPSFKRFIAACVGRPRVFEYADPIAGLVATILPPAGRYPWHYDTNEFVLTIMINKPDSGGVFEYAKDLRSPGEENLGRLGEILNGERRELIRATDVEAGDLQLFLGRYSLHRVTQVEGTRPRHVLVLSYADRPGVIGPVDRTRSVYGRVTEAHLLASDWSTTAPDGLVL